MTDENPTEPRAISPEAILLALSLANGSVTRAAVALGVSRATLYRWVATNPQVKGKLAPRKPGKPAKLPFRIVWWPPGHGPKSETWPNRDVASAELARRGLALDKRGGRVRNARGVAIGRGRELTQHEPAVEETRGGP